MKSIRLSLTMAALSFGTVLAHAQSLVSWGFEAPAYTDGASTVGVDGWAAGSGSGNTQTITSAAAASGSQSLAFVNTSSGNLATYSVKQGYNFVAGLDYTISAKVLITSASQQNRVFGLYVSNGAGLGGTVLGMTISGNGRLRAGTDWTSTYDGTPTVAGVGTYANRWLQFDLSVTAAGNATATFSGFGGATSSYSFNFSGVNLTGSGMSVQVGSDYRALTARQGTGAFDDVSVNAVPEPASIAALTLGGLALLRRRRA